MQLLLSLLAQRGAIAQVPVASSSSAGGGGVAHAQLPGGDSNEAAKKNMQAPAIELASGDLLQITVFDTPELSAQVRVDQQGEIDLPWGGKLHVEGSSPGRLAAQLQNLLQEQEVLKRPHGVSVFVLEYATQGVKILGQVKSPGVYPLLGAHRLLDMIALAGGVTDMASRGVTVIHQNEAAQPANIKLDYSNEGVVQANVSVLPGDTIIVLKAGVVYVLGDVGRPGGFLLQDNQRLTVLQALSLAQGINKTARLKSAVIFRETPSGRLQYHVELKKLLHGEHSDMMLADRDVLYVPSSIGKTLGYRGIELAAQTTAGVLIYRP